MTSGDRALSIIGGPAGTLIVIIGCRVTRWFAPRLRVDARNQAGCGYEEGRTMKPAPLRYSRPGSTAEALALLASLGEDGKVLAGGQSLVPLLSMRLAAPEHLVDINRLAELGYVRVEDGQVRVGALARHAEVLADPAAAAAQPLLAKALRFVAHAAIRNRGTTVGSIVHADPAGEMPAVLAVLDGAVRVAHQGAERLVPAREFFLGPLESAVEPGELATEALFPVLPPAAGTGFAEVSRRRGDYAVCGVAATVRLGEDGRIAQARTAYLSVGPSPLVLDLTEATAVDGTDGFAAAADLARQQLDPEPDIHATADYRRHLAGVLTQRALLEALGEAQVRNGAGNGSAGGTTSEGTARD
jgi:carbon-monoxide dehydrogenase medium subunit